MVGKGEVGTGIAAHAGSAAQIAKQLQMQRWGWNPHQDCQKVVAERVRDVLGPVCRGTMDAVSE